MRGEQESACRLRGGPAAYLALTSRGLEWRREPRLGRYGPRKRPGRINPGAAGRLALVFAVLLAARCSTRVSGPGFGLTRSRAYEAAYSERSIGHALL
ncbi:hypothetical protein NDU88_006706 [Pleurodeles waltl]|uniref:Uncharacterized protein n=1 Tax=Pleurodeles waltl TaxID=8319 RepID=A0AAV7QLZ1_PLEWA|nr:hypothetical protein NDU88_006706 [Pleurodeles waltl]